MIIIPLINDATCHIKQLIKIVKEKWKLFRVGFVTKVAQVFKRLHSIAFSHPLRLTLWQVRQDSRQPPPPPHGWLSAHHHPSISPSLPAHSEILNDNFLDNFPPLVPRMSNLLSQSPGVGLPEILRWGAGEVSDTLAIYNVSPSRLILNIIILNFLWWTFYELNSLEPTSEECWASHIKGLESVFPLQ